MTTWMQFVKLVVMTIYTVSKETHCKGYFYLKYKNYLELVILCKFGRSISVASFFHFKFHYCDVRYISSLFF